MAGRELCLPQAWLRSKGPKALLELQQTFSLKVRRHVWHQNLVHLSYDQLTSPLRIPLVQQCRGLILDESNQWEVIARPFDKFFNYGEAAAAAIDWRTARVLEKLDGTYIIMYHYHGKWHTATTGTADALGEIGDTGQSYSELFWETFDAMGYSTPPQTAKHLTFLWELTAPQNRVVVRYKEPRITLLGVRNRLNGEEHFDSDYGYATVQSFALKDLASAVETFDTMDPLQQEGYVVVDSRFNRIKVKHPGYITLHHLKNNGIMTHKRAIEIVQAGEVDEVVASFPEYKDIIFGAKAAIGLLQDAVVRDWCHIDAQANGNRKAFAKMACATPYPGLLFSRLDGHINNVYEGIAKMPIDSLFLLLKNIGYRTAPAIQEKERREAQEAPTVERV